MEVAVKWEIRSSRITVIAWSALGRQSIASSVKDRNTISRIWVKISVHLSGR